VECQGTKALIPFRELRSPRSTDSTFSPVGELVVMTPKELEARFARLISRGWPPSPNENAEAQELYGEVILLARHIVRPMIRNEADADDLVCQCLVNVLLLHIRACPIKNLRGYIRATARCEAAHMAGKTLARREVPLVDGYPSPALREAETIRRRLSLRRVPPFFRRLGHCQQKLALLRWGYELSPAEIAVSLGRTPGSVRVALCNLRRRLLRMVESQVSAPKRNTRA